jgi:hypothetical protein
MRLGPGLETYTLVYLVGGGPFQLSQEEMQALYGYLQGGGTVLIESCRRELASTELPADAAFADLLASLGIQLTPLPAGHRVLVEPFLFAVPPPGFEGNGSPQVLIGGVSGDQGVLFSTFDHGCLWQGERRGRTASREEIRAALEWGENIVVYALERQSRTEAAARRARHG